MTDVLNDRELDQRALEAIDFGSSTSVFTRLRELSGESVSKAAIGTSLGMISVQEVYVKLATQAQQTLDFLGPYETSGAHVSFGFNIAWAASKILDRLPRPVQYVAGFFGAQTVNLGVEGAQGLMLEPHNVDEFLQPLHVPETINDATMVAAGVALYGLVNEVFVRRRD